MDGLTIEVFKGPAVADQAVEIVERKGTGHPDYICDAVMESISVELSREYIKRFGSVLHHNIDKGLLVAGVTEKGFGGGRVLKPMEFIVGDRATFRAGSVDIPVNDIAEAAVYGWLADNLPEIRPQEHATVRVVLQPGSAELSGIFTEKGKVMGANDTSAAVGYAPFTPTERAVYETERFINSPAFKERFPETGRDVKVMGVRRGTTLDITMACPLMARFVRGESEYFERKKAVCEAVEDFLKGFPFTEIRLNYNTLDKKGAGLKGVYLTLFGTSAEDADSGQVGRGNRVNGVISLNRPMGTEAAAGKNPVSHVGKIYSVLANQTAAEIYGSVDNLKEVYVWLLSRIGSPIDRPAEAYVRIVPESGFREKGFQEKVSSILAGRLAGIETLTAELSRGAHPVC